MVKSEQGERQQVTGSQIALSFQRFYWWSEFQIATAEWVVQIVVGLLSWLAAKDGPAQRLLIIDREEFLLRNMEEQIVLDAKSAATLFPHNWEHMFGSCHASTTLCEDWRNVHG